MFRCQLFKIMRCFVSRMQTVHQDNIFLLLRILFHQSQTANLGTVISSRVVSSLYIYNSSRGFLFHLQLGKDLRTDFIIVMGQRKGPDIKMMGFLFSSSENHCHCHWQLEMVGDVFRWRARKRGDLISKRHRKREGAREEKNIFL